MSQDSTHEVLKAYMEQRGRLLERTDLIRPCDASVPNHLLYRSPGQDKEDEKVRERNHKILVGEIDKIDRRVMMILRPNTLLQHKDGELKEVIKQDEQ